MKRTACICPEKGSLNCLPKDQLWGCPMDFQALFQSPKKTVNRQQLNVPLRERHYLKSACTHGFIYA